MKKFVFIICMFLAFQALAQPQNALHFDGFDDYVEVPAASGVLTGNNGFSMACWVNPTNTAPAFPNFDGIIGYRNENNADFYIIQLSATQYEARFRNSNNQAFTITSPTVQLNSWQHLALVFTGSQLRFYHNGQLSQSITASGSITNSNVAFKIGRISFQIYDFNFNGQIDEVGLWSRALSDTEITCIYQQKVVSSMPGLTHFYSMDQGTAGGNNISVTALNDQASNLNGWLYGFALNGTTSNFVAGTSQATEILDTICPGGSYSLGGQSFNQAGNYTVLLPGAEGCDSTIYLQLAVSSINTAVLQNRDTLRATNAQAIAWQWLDCNNGFSPVSGANAAEFIASANGSYAVEITENGCTDTSICLQVSTVSLTNFHLLKHLQCFPNPGIGQLFINSTIEGTTQLHIFDMFGHLIWSSEVPNGQIEIATFDWPVGTYIIHAKHPQGVARIKWQKKKLP